MVPALQLGQADAPELDWYEPAGHSVHDDDPSAAAIVPALHDVQMARAPVLANEPKGHLAHAPAPAAALNWPALQLKHVDSPSLGW